MRLLKAEDGVSESLGFVLISLILMIVMAAVLMVGYPIYQKSINEGHMQNMVEGFYLLAANANKVALYESPIQSSELQLYGGTMAIKENARVIISTRYWDPATGADATWQAADQYKLLVMEYSSNNQKVGYIMGGVFKDVGGKTIMLKDPVPYQYTDGAVKTIVIPIIASKNPNEIDALAGSEYTRLEFGNPLYSREMPTLIYPEAIHQEYVKEITITITSDYNDALGDYFKNEIFTFQPAGGSLQVSSVGNVMTIHQVYDPTGNPPLPNSANSITIYIPQCELYATLK